MTLEDLIKEFAGRKVTITPVSTAYGVATFIVQFIEASI